MAAPNKARRMQLAARGKADKGGGGVKRGGYPTDTPGRAVAAKGRSTAALAAGRISASKKAEIDRRANRELGKGRG